MKTSDELPLLAGVCGDPVGHSKSPRLFRHWFAAFGIDGAYVPLLIAPGDLETVLRALPKAGFRGVNVTLPHKQAALALADSRTDGAAAIGAANTLTFLPDGRIHADNTDGFGFIENLRASAPGWTPADGPVVMLGAGGAARAAIHTLLDQGAPEVRLANRTRERAEELARRFGPKVTVIDWSRRDGAMAQAATIVNSTSLGMKGQPPLEVGLGAAPGHAVVMDMVYSPLETGLLGAARRRGLRAVDGLGMLLHQARPGFHRWFGRDPEVTDDLRAACLEPGP